METSPRVVLSLTGAALVTSVVMNVALLTSGGAEPEPAPAAVCPPAVPRQVMAAAPDTSSAPANAPAVVVGNAPPTTPVPTASSAMPSASAPGAAADAVATPQAAPTPSSGSVRVAHGIVAGAIPQTMRAAGVEQADAVSAVLTRALMWDLDLRRDLRAGDRVEVAWTENGDGTVDLVGARYASERLGQTLTAYRFQASGDRYARYWNADGVEVERRLVNGPIEDYEQITSLLRDRPTHHGMDFMAATGTDVVSPFAGVVTRSNWNHAANGNCLEIELADGTLVKMLHLSENLVGPGDRVTAGQLVARSGNTGHSTGPHLHYQLNRGDRVLDPVDVHGTTRRQLPPQDRAAFDAEVARIDALLQHSTLVASN